MGSYGIGLARTMAAVIEQNNDSDGIMMAGINCSLSCNNSDLSTWDNAEQVDCAEKLYAKLQAKGIEVLCSTTETEGPV